MPVSVRSALPSLALLAALGAASCGDSTTDPPLEFELPDEMPIHAAINDRLTIFGHTTEANAVLRHALGVTLRDLSVPAAWTGSTAVYDPTADDWVADVDAPEVPADVARITWYAMSGEFVTLPVEERGHIDLVPAGDGALTTIGVTATRTGTQAGVLADYVLTFGDSESASARTALFEGDGFVGDGTRQLAFQLRQEEVEPVGAGAESFDYSLNLSNQGFAYAGSVAEVTGGASVPVAVDLLVSVTVGGVTTRVELGLTGSSQQALQGGGTVRHDGRHIADIVMSGGQMAFNRPDGRAYRSHEQQKLGTLTVILLNPMTAVEPYFW